jgi:hypothetical protein
MTALKFIILGFFVKIITGLDDTVTHVPVIASITRTRMGKVAFSIGTLAAVLTAIIIAVFFSAIIKDFPSYRYITAGLIIFLAVCIYFDVFVTKPRKQAEIKLFQKKQISLQRFTKLAIIGFIASLATVLDDIIAYLPLFTADSMSVTIYAASGILLGTILEILLVIYFSEKIAKIKYKEEIAAIGLLILALFILLEVI